MKPLVTILAALLGATTANPVRAADADEAPAPPVLAVCADPDNLPFSNERGEGFENRIAAILADELGRGVRYTFNQQRRSFLRRTLNSGACDVVMGLPVGLQGVMQTRPYYRSSYVFVTAARRGLDLRGFDDPALRGLRIGLQAIGAEGANTPPAGALARRGLADHVVGFPMWADDGEPSPPARLVEAVAQGRLDTAVLWGPFAGYYAQRHAGALVITAVESDPRAPEVAFGYDIAVGVRKGDAPLRDALQQALDRRRADIDAVLRDYGLPPSPARAL